MSLRIDPVETTLSPIGDARSRDGSTSPFRPQTYSRERLSNLRVLAVHAFYQQLGGEDVVFNTEAEMLESRGHHVIRFTRNNSDIGDRSLLGKAQDAIWNRAAAKEIAEIVHQHEIDVVHFHNEFPVISPAAFRSARSAGAAVVKTLHNVRPLCPKAVCFRDGKACQVCVKRQVAWRGIWEGCYRGSRAATAITSLSAWVHRHARSFQRHVDICIAPTAHVQRTYEQAGYPISRIVIKPHFIETDLGLGAGQGGYAMFAGRLSEEKGIQVLLDAWKKLAAAPPLMVVGDGPMMDEVARAGPPVDCAGHLPKDEVYQRMGEASCLILPSSCAETFGRVAVEAFSRGTPVICADLGGQAEVVVGESGLRFRPGDSDDLAAKVRELFADAKGLVKRRVAARKAYEDFYNATLNYEQLINVYAEALQVRGHRIDASSEITDGDDHDQLGRRSSIGRTPVRSSS